jgi:hypothetical protein
MLSGEKMYPDEYDVSINILPIIFICSVFVNKNYMSYEKSDYYISTLPIQFEFFNIQESSAACFFR